MPSSCWPELLKFNKWPFFSLSFICNISAYLLFQTNFFFHHKVLFSPMSFVFKVFLLGHLAPLQHADNKCNFQHCSPQMLLFATETMKALPWLQQECCLCSKGSTGYQHTAVLPWWGQKHCWGQKAQRKEQRTFLCFREIFFFQLQFDLRLKVSIIKAHCMAYCGCPSSHNF